MPTRETYLRREIELLEQKIIQYQEAVGDMKRELLTIQGKPMNSQQNYGGNIHPGKTNFVTPRNCSTPAELHHYDPAPAIERESKALNTAPIYGATDP